MCVRVECPRASLILTISTSAKRIIVPPHAPPPQKQTKTKNMHSQQKSLLRCHCAILGYTSVAACRSLTGCSSSGRCSFWAGGGYRLVLGRCFSGGGSSHLLLQLHTCQCIYHSKPPPSTPQKVRSCRKAPPPPPKSKSKKSTCGPVS